MAPHHAVVGMYSRPLAPAVIAVVTFITAFCCLSYELILAQAMSSLLGGTVLRYTMTIGLYLCSLGIGSFFCERVAGKSILHKLIRIEIFLSIVGALAPFIFFLGDWLALEALRSHGLNETLAYAIRHVGMHATIIIIGMAAGMEIPLLLRLGDELAGQNYAGKILAIDYIGSFAAAIYFPLAALPNMGLFGTAAFIGFLNCVAALLLLGIDTERLSENLKSMAALILLGLWLGLGVGFESQVSRYVMTNFFIKDSVSLAPQTQTDNALDLPATNDADDLPLPPDDDGAEDTEEKIPQ